MRRISYASLSTVILGVGLFCSSVALADPRSCPGFTPTPNSAALFLREFNDCPSSIVSSINAYPALIQVDDQNVDCLGGANLHSWNFSTDGTTTAIFENCSIYRFCADVTLNATGFNTGDGSHEGGLRVSPWWNAPHYAVDGRFMLNGKTGEIACFGGRLPFFSFTGTYGLHYVVGTTAHMEIIYDPNQLGSPAGAPPATITYKLQLPGGPVYSSPPLNFDQGNTAEDPPHGLWGELNACGVGGYAQHTANGTPRDFQAKWENICFYNDRPVPAFQSTWGKIKTLYR